MIGEGGGGEVEELLTDNKEILYVYFISQIHTELTKIIHDTRPMGSIEL